MPIDYLRFSMIVWIIVSDNIEFGGSFIATLKILKMFLSGFLGVFVWVYLFLCKNLWSNSVCYP